MSIVARQFGHPRGIFGRMAGRLMARGNAGLNRWLVDEVGRLGVSDVNRIVEIGPGPGVGLQEILRVFKEAHVWGIDLSPEMLSQSRKRNSREIHSGRLVLLQGDVASLQQLAPVDLVLATHVLYFWHRPATELAAVHSALRPGGWLGLGYQLRANMPAISQKNFPNEGHLLYDSDDVLAGLLQEAGFRHVQFVVKGPATAPEGRMAFATA